MKHMTTKTEKNDFDTLDNALNEVAMTTEDMSGNEDEEEFFDDDDDAHDEYVHRKTVIIGSNIRRHRKKRRFSIEDLAQNVGLSTSYIGLIERGDRCPSVKIIFKLCEIFGITPNELMEPKPGSINALLVAEKKYSYQDKYDAVISLLYGLDEKELEFTASTLKAYRRLIKAVDDKDDREVPLKK